MKIRFHFILAFLLILFSLSSLFLFQFPNLIHYTMSLPSIVIVSGFSIYLALPPDLQTAKRDTCLFIAILGFIFIAHLCYFVLAPKFHFLLGIPHLHPLSINASINFSILGFALYLKSHLEKKTARILLLQACFFLVALNSFIALTGYALDFSNLYLWNNHSTSSLSSNLCALAICTMMYSQWKKSPARDAFYLAHPDKEILLTSCLILCLLASFAGLAGFYLAWKQYEKAQTELIHNAFSKKILFLNNLKESLLKAHLNINQQLSEGNHPLDQMSLLNLSLNTDFSALEFKNAQKQTLLSLGQWQTTATWTAFISKNPDIRLNYKNQFYVDMQGHLKNQDAFRAQWILNTMQYLFKDDPYFRSWICNTEKEPLCLSIDPQSNSASIQTKTDWNRFLLEKKHTDIQLSDHHFLLLHPITENSIFALEFDNSAWQTYLSFAIAIAIFIFAFFTALGAFLLYKKVLPLVNTVIGEKEKAQTAAQALFESENRFRQTFDASVSGIALIDLQGHFIKANARFYTITEYTANDLNQISLSALQCPEDWADEKRAWTQLFDREIHFFHRAKNLILKSGQTLWVDYSLTLLRNHQDQPLHFMIQIQDMSYQKKSEERLSLRAYFDALTGLANRHHLEQSLEKNILSALNQQQSFAIFFLDLDKFKQVNDTLGHEAGDILLKIVAERLTAHTRSTDIVARLGGDEFIMVLSGLSNKKSTEHFAEKIINHIIAPIHIYGHELFITTSIGISFYPQDGHDAQTLIKNADTALYRAKRLGKNRYCFFNDDKNAASLETHQTLSLEKNLKTAIQDNQLILHFQPVQEIHPGNIIQVETLLRSQNGKLSNLSTHSLIHLAVEIGLIEKLSLWILDSACKAIQNLRKTFPNLMVSVNIAPYYFSHRHFISQVQHCLEIHNLPVNTLILEFRENLLMQNPDTSLTILNTLKELGVSTALDNFGSGYSSLHLLKKFPLDFIKLDRSILQTPELLNEKYLKQFVLFLNEFNFKVIFEGVETESHYQLIQQIPCHAMQGYYFTPPLAIDKLHAFLHEHAKTTIIIH